MANLESLYQELILQHYRKPRNRGEIESPSVEIAMNNPTCGDEIVLRLSMDEGSIRMVRFEGHGCSISQASASMMTQQIEGKTLEQSREIATLFTRLMHGDAEAAKDRSLGDLRALAGVAKFPVRIRCALLAWNALGEADKVLTSRGVAM